MPPEKPRNAKHRLGTRSKPLCRSFRTTTPTQPALAEHSARTTHAGSGRSPESAPGPPGRAPAQEHLRREGQESLPRNVRARTPPCCSQTDLSPPARITHAPAPDRYIQRSRPHASQAPSHSLPSDRARLSSTNTGPSLAPDLLLSKTPARWSPPSCPSTCPVSQVQPALHKLPERPIDTKRPRVAANDCASF